MAQLILQRVILLCKDDSGDKNNMEQTQLIIKKLKIWLLPKMEWLNVTNTKKQIRVSANMSSFVYANTLPVSKKAGLKLLGL